MFSENNRISERQAFRLLTFDLLGLSTLLVPGLLAKTAGRDGIFCIVIGIIASLFYLRLLKAIVEDCTTTFPIYLEQRLGGVAGRLIQAGIFLYFLLLAGYTAYLFSDVVLQSLLREESFYLVLTLVLILVLYGIWGGLEGRARVYEILFWILMISLFLMLFFALDEIRVDYWIPVFSSDVSGIAAGSYYVFVCFAIIFLVLFLGNYVEKKEHLFISGRRAILFTGSIHAVLYVILVGVFGSKALGTIRYPAVTLMSTVRISGAFLKRTDAFMFAIWFFTLYALLASCVFYSGNILAQMLGRCLQKCEIKKREKVSYVVVVLLVGSIAVCFYKAYVWMEYYEMFLWYVGTPFLILIPIILVPARNRTKRNCGKMAAGIALFLVSSNLLTGCGTAELEDRNFPIEMAVQNTDEFSEEFLNTEGAGNRMIDYSHLKVLVLSRAFVENESAMRQMLTVLEQKNEIPQSVYLVVAEDADEIVNMKETLGESVGEYLEKMFENVSEVNIQEYPTLGMLYQESDNQNETLFIPCVSKSQDGLTIDHYYVWRRGSAFGIVDSQTAMLSFFTQNQMEKYQMILENGTVVSLFDAHNEIAFAEEGDRKTVTAKIRCSGEVITPGEDEEGNTGQISAVIQDYMNQIAKKNLEERQIDITNSFRKLGFRRDWFALYQDDNASYEQDIEIIYDVSIDWTNL